MISDPDLGIYYFDGQFNSYPIPNKVEDWFNFFHIVELGDISWLIGW